MLPPNLDCLKTLLGNGVTLQGFDLGHIRRAVILVLLLILSACVPEVKPPITAPQALTRLHPRQFPDFADDMSYDSLETAINQSIEYLNRLDPSTLFHFGPDTFTASHLAASMESFGRLAQQRLSGNELKKAIENSFWVYKSIGRDGQGQVLFTGYYEPVLQGSLNASPDYPYPVYRKPDDWVSVDLGLFNHKYAHERIIGQLVNQTITPYSSRKNIDSEGHLRGKGYELAWVSDRVELFFLHIQGSGQVILEDGTVLHIGYDCTNGRPYQSIGRLLINEGRISKEEMSLQQLRSYLRSNPEDMARIFNFNESYIFFRLVDYGPLGALEVPITPDRSVATDLRLFPKAALAFIQTEKPLVDERSNQRARASRYLLGKGALCRGCSRPHEAQRFAFLSCPKKW
jgi:membrane-bound lytic murein transglycosylase A